MATIEGRDRAGKDEDRDQVSSHLSAVIVGPSSDLFPKDSVPVRLVGLIAWPRLPWPSLGALPVFHGENRSCYKPGSSAEVRRPASGVVSLMTEKITLHSRRVMVGERFLLKDVNTFDTLVLSRGARGGLLNIVGDGKGPF